MERLFKGKPIDWRNGMIEFFANMFFVFIAVMIFKVFPLQDISWLLTMLVVGLLYALVVLVFQSAWVDMNPVLSVFKVLKHARTIQESAFRIAMQLVGAIAGGAAAAYVTKWLGVEVAGLAQFTGLEGGQIIIIEFMATALFFMVIMRITSLAPNIHTMVTGLGLFGGLLVTTYFTGGLTISPIWAIGNAIGHQMVGVDVSWYGFGWMLLGSLLVLPVAGFCHYCITLGGKNTWEDIR